LRGVFLLFPGIKERVSEVLNRKRGLALAMIRRLHEGLGIPADLLLKPYSVTKTRPARTKSDIRV
jgi:hypothetical protein